MKRSKHGLSNYKLFTCDMGQLVPVGIYEVLPGDSIQHSTSILLRVAPLVSPVMHPVQVRLHHWFVPHRLTDDNWEDFITGGPNGESGVNPPMNEGVTTPALGSVTDYMGLPPGIVGADWSQMPVSAYNLIFNECYRDQDLVTARLATDTTVARIAWEKDYFTTARLTSQKGPEVTLPLGTRAPVKGIGKDSQTFGGASPNVYETDGTGPITYASAAVVGDSLANRIFYAEEDPDNTGFPNIWADLAEASSVDVNTVRRAFALQRFMEARSRYGSRYTEYLASLGVRSSDARLQRPEYLGGGKQTISFSEILQTGPDTFNPDDENTGVGNLKGHGIAALRSRKWRRFFEEHGYVITLMSVRPRTIYASGQHKMWNRTTNMDYWQKELEFIGQQEIANREVYAAAAAPTDRFGYQDRYAEYRHIPSTIAGEFRTTLDYWHMARIFGSEPVLNSAFVTCSPTDRIYASTDTNELWCMASHSIQARRLVSRSAAGRII